MTERTSVSRTVLWAVSTGIGIQGILILSGVLVARILGVENRGYLALFALLPVVVSQLGNLGLPQALPYFIAAYPGFSRAIVRSVLPILAAQVGLLTGVHALLLFVLLADNPISVRIAAYCTLLVVAGVLGQQYGLGILQGQQRFRAFNTLRLMPTLSYAAAVLALSALGHGSLLLVSLSWAIGNLLVGGATLLVALARTWAAHPAAGGAPPSLGEMLRFGLKGLPGSTSPVETFRVDQAVVGLFLSPAALGLYVVAMAFTNLPRFVGQSVGMVAYPQVAREIDPATRRRSLWRFVWFTLALSSVIVLPLEIAAPTLVPLFFGNQFSSAARIARILLVAALLLSVRRVLSDAARGEARPTVGTAAEVASWVALVATLPLFASLWDVEGVALALVVSAAASLAVLATAVALSGRAERLAHAGPAVLLALPRVDARAIAPSLVRLLAALPLVAVGLALARFSPDLRIAVPVLAGLVVLMLIPLVPRQGVAGNGFRSPAHHLGFAFLGCALVLVSWNGVKVTWERFGIFDMSLFYFALVPAAILLALDAVGARSLVVPPWLVGAAGGIAVAAILTEVLPPSTTYLADRFTSTSPLVKYAHVELRSSDLANFVKLELGIFLLPLLVALAGATRALILRLADLWALSGVISAAIALSDTLKLTDISQGVLGIPLLERESGLTSQPNHLAVMSAISLPVVTLWLLRSRPWRMLGAVSLGLLFAGVYASGSRGGLVVVSLGFIATLLAVPRLRYLTLRFSVVGLVLIVVFFSHFGGSAVRAVGSHARFGPNIAAYRSDAMRREVARQARQDIAEEPLHGVGFGVVNEAHSIYLQLLASGGAIALASFLIFVAGTARTARTALERDRDVTLALTIAVAAWLTAGLVENQLVNGYLYVPVGLLIAIARQSHSRPSQELAEQRAVRPALTLATTEGSS